MTRGDDSLPRPEVLAGWLAGQRWFAAKTRRIAAVRTVDAVPLGGAVVAILDVTLDDGSRQRYAAPLGPGSTVADALEDADFCRALLALIARGGRAAGAAGELRGEPVVADLLDVPGDAAIRRLAGEQTHTSVVVGRALILKHFRTLAAGTNPEVEIGRFLTERARFPDTPRLAGHLEYRAADGTTTALAVAQELVEGARDGWEWMLEELAGFYARAGTAGGAAAPDRAAGLAALSLAALSRLGGQTAALHGALAGDPRDPAFAPEPITAADIDAWSAGIGAQLAAARAALGAGGALGDVPNAAAGLGGLLGRRKIRHHGDFHLGQTLYREAAGAFVIIDFEGEPIRPLEERRRKHAAVRDVAGLLRSLDYAAVVARRDDALAPWGDAWTAEAERAYLGGYRARAGAAAFLPATDAGFTAALAAFELEKAAYEVVYEADHRPAWIDIPRRGLLRAAARLRRAVAGA
jgi:maltose alpha-D-glucosyltransferase/alpha-amylase